MGVNWWYVCWVYDLISYHLLALILTCRTALLMPVRISLGPGPGVAEGWFVNFTDITFFVNVFLTNQKSHLRSKNVSTSKLQWSNMYFLRMQIFAVALSTTKAKIWTFWRNFRQWLHQKSNSKLPVNQWRNFCPNGKIPVHKIPAYIVYVAEPLDFSRVSPHSVAVITERGFHGVSWSSLPLRMLIDSVLWSLIPTFIVNTPPRGC